jgi:signal transduction histidine kinase
MNTFFASPERLADEDIRKQFLYASNNPVMDAVLNAGAGLLAILNAQRQIITVNKSLLDFLNVESPETVLGLRPEIKSDYSLLLRVLMNLLINALEASVAGEQVTCSIEKSETEIIFNLKNHAFINPDIQRRIFQQYFSTKMGNGRGFGTFGTKLICEKFLHGTVDFSTSESAGTHFRVKIPVHHP